jgi:hypothetical protein
MAIFEKVGRIRKPKSPGKCNLLGLFVPLKTALPHHPKLSGVGIIMLMIMEDGNIEFCFFAGAKVRCFYKKHF